MKRLRLLQTVRGDFPIGHNTIAYARVYEPDEISINPHGAVSVRVSDGWLGIKPDEMEWIDDAVAVCPLCGAPRSDSYAPCGHDAVTIAKCAS